MRSQPLGLLLLRLSLRCYNLWTHVAVHISVQPKFKTRNYHFICLLNLGTIEGY